MNRPLFVSRAFRASAGFTLVEVLVVLVLIGITVGVVTLSVGNAGDREAELEARRLAALVNLASEEAVLKSEEIGILFRHDGYEFLTQTQEPGKEPQWVSLGKDDMFRVRTLPKGFVLAAYADGLPINLDDNDKKKPVPHGFLLSSGERTAVEVELGPEHGVRYRVVIPIIGDPAVEAPRGREARR